MKSSDRSCCGAGRCRKLDSGTPVRVAFGGDECACALKKKRRKVEDKKVGGLTCVFTLAFLGKLFCEMSSRGFLDCDYGIVAASSLWRHLTFATRRNEGTQIEAHGARVWAPRVKLKGTRWLNYPASKAVSVATVPVTPMTSVKFDFKFLRILQTVMEFTTNVFLKESFCPVVLLWSYICVYVRLVLTGFNMMASPILDLTPLDFNSWDQTKDLVESERDEDHKRKREEGRESEERINPFRKSKKVERSPVKKAMDEEMKKMLEKIMEDVGEIKEENRKMSRELEQLKSMMREKEEKWEREKIELKEKMTKLEEKMEEQEKRVRKKNIVVTGLDEEECENEKKLEKWMKAELEVEGRKGKTNMERNKGENEQIRIVFWNVAGIKNKENEFWKYLGEFDVVGLVETWVEEKRERKQERESERWDNNGCEKGTGRRKRIWSKRRKRVYGKNGKKKTEKMENCNNIQQKYERNEENNRRASKRAGRRNSGRRMEEQQATIERRPTKDGIENAEGRELVSLVEERGWDVLNGNCIGDEKGEYTYIGSRGETVIDYVMVNEEAWDEIEEFKVGERVESDHMPLEVRTKGREKERSIKDVKRKIVKNIWTEEGKEKYRARLREAKYEEEEINEKVRELSENEEYKRARKRYKLVCKEKKEKKRMEEEMKMKGIKTEEEVWRYIYRERKKKGEIVSDRITMEEWRKYFSELLGGEENRQEKEKRQHRVGEIEEITREELEQQLRKLKRKKAPGRDGIQNESWIYGTEREVDRLLEIMNGLWKGGGFPQEWKEGIICHIYKKGEKDTASNYRGITLLNTAYKVYAMMVEERLMKEMNERGALPDGQAGFRKGRGTMDNT
ncbi:hypothetical protein GEV33_008637 [Tenebrio molitor]|uniref:Trichohyalin-like n=1 Tax=Tenebrio molitor TaxID=7067 RepID=A0A8J6HG82_TENMO|nr:hypothetical protein GEV33_008637 [Tenebrio molitor]